MTDLHQVTNSSSSSSSSSFCLYDPTVYNPDTLNLDGDPDAREYWINVFVQLVKKFAIQAAQSQRNEASAAQRADDFQIDYTCRIQAMNTENATEPLTIRKLLELHQLCLKLHGFNDPWKEQKILENTAALQLFRKRIDFLDQLPDEEKWLEVFKGILAGNIFDWGAQAVTEIIKENSFFGLSDALKLIQPRPWLIDGFNEWFKRLQGPSHRCAVIFVDNSGVDIVLGIMPFARELLIRRTKVILCANTGPSLNDITSDELDDVVRKCCDQCNILRCAYQERDLSIYANGHCSPCLDMRQIPLELTEAISQNKADLLVIEGMGRALHTNLNEKFNCDTLKLAVIKNKWWATRLGGDIFSIICKYEPI